MNNPLFDQTGYFSASLAAAKKYPQTHEPWVYLCNGQADALTVIGDNYRLGTQNAIDYYLANGVKVILGLSCHFDPRDAWYELIGSPAIEQILSDYEGSDLVKPGANLYKELGTDIILNGAHLYPRGYELAGELVGDALIKALV